MAAACLSGPSKPDKKMASLGLLPELSPIPQPCLGHFVSFKITTLLKPTFERAIKMSFGWSASDIAECIKLLVKVGNALKDSGGSAAEYQSAVDFLKGVETTVQGVDNILQNHPDLKYQAAFEEHATNLMTAVTHFREKTDGYDTSLGANATTSKTKKTWKKIKLALFGHVEELKLAVSYPQSVVNDLIGLQGLLVLWSMKNDHLAK